MTDHRTTSPADHARLVRTVYTGLAAVGLAAAVLSFDAWTGLARLVGITGHLGPVWLDWLLPITVDAYAITATGVWLAGRTISDSTRAYARACAIGAILLSVAGNATYHGLTSVHVGAGTMDWRIVVAVSAIPPLVLGLVGHLVALVGRDRRTDQTTDTNPVRTAAVKRTSDSGPVNVDQTPVAGPATTQTPHRPKVRRPLRVPSVVRTIGPADDTADLAKLHANYPDRTPSLTQIQTTLGCGRSKAVRLRGLLTQTNHTAESADPEPAIAGAN